MTTLLLVATVATCLPLFVMYHLFCRVPILVIQTGFLFAEFFFDKFLFQFTEWVFVCRAFYVALSNVECLPNVCR
jgi:hypothetical protein